MIKVGDYIICNDWEHKPLSNSEVCKIREIVILDNEPRYVLYGYNDRLFNAVGLEYYDYYNIPYDDGTYPIKPCDVKTEVELRIYDNKTNVVAYKDLKLDELDLIRENIKLKFRRL